MLIADSAYEEVIPTSSQILSKLDLERLILDLRTRFVHITSKFIIIVIQSSHIFGPNVYANAFCVYVAMPLIIDLYFRRSTKTSAIQKQLI